MSGGKEDHKVSARREFEVAIQSRNGEESIALSKYLRACKDAGDTRVEITGTKINTPLKLSLGEVEIELRFIHLQARQDVEITQTKFRKGLIFFGLSCTEGKSITFTDCEFEVGVAFEKLETRIRKLSFMYSFHEGLANRGILAALAIQCAEKGGVEEICIENMDVSEVVIPNLFPTTSLSFRSCDLQMNVFDIIQRFPTCGLFDFSQSILWSLASLEVPNSSLRVNKLLFSKTNFKMGCNVRNLECKGDLDLSESVCDSSINFCDCEFRGNVLCKSLEVAVLSFGGSAFYKRLQISDSRRKIDEIVLSSAKFFFESELLLERFETSRLLLSSGGNAEFQGLFAKKIEVTDLFEIQKRTVLGQFTVEDSKIGKFDATKTKFENVTSFDGTTFTRAPEFFASEFYYDTSFNEAKFVEISGKTGGAYRRMKSLASSIDHDVEAAIFSALEMKSRYFKLRWQRNFLEICVSKLYNFINDHGKSLARPLIWLFVLGFCGFWIYLWTDDLQVVKPREDARYDWVGEPGDWTVCGKAAMHTFVNSLGPLKLIEMLSITVPKGMGVLALTAIHAVLASVMWFFLILGIRKRFKTG